MKRDNQNDPGINISAAIKAGNEKAFELLYRAEYSNLKYFLSRYLPDYTEIEDIVHESFLTLWDGRDKINPEQSIKAFLFTIARNRAINLLRKRSFKLTDSLEKSEISFRIKALNDEYLSSRIDLMDMKRVIEKTYEMLPEKIKESFVLSREGEMSYREISDKLGISVKTVEHNISAALKIFKRKLGRFLSLLIFLWG
ncbi:MAG: RNA polymerase sigma-70 factor [Bacteroidales bacterium]